MINLSSFPNFIKQTRKQVLDEAKVQAFKYRCYDALEWGEIKYFIIRHNNGIIRPILPYHMVI